MYIGFRVPLHPPIDFRAAAGSVFLPDLAVLMGAGSSLQGPTSVRCSSTQRSNLGINMVPFLVVRPTLNKGNKAYFGVDPGKK